MKLDRLAFDANALLNAIFVPPSWSKRVHDEAVRRKCPVVVGSETRAEAVRKAREYAEGLQKRVDPEPLIAMYLKFWGVLEVAPALIAVPAQIPLHDAHVYREAFAADATILTSDAELWRASGNRAALPLQVLREWNPEEPAFYLNGVEPTSECGSVFFRGYPNWGGIEKLKGRFFAFEFGGRARLYYDAMDRAWIAELPGVRRLRVSAPVPAGEAQNVAISWRAGEVARLRVATVDHPDEAKIRHGISAPWHTAAVGHSTAKQEHWNGAVNAFVMNDRPISSDLWRALRKSSVLTPNPFDSDRLRFGVDRKLAF
jgi:hypothetical protein